MSDGGKGSERLHARTQIDDKEMERKWEQTFAKKEVTMEEVEEIYNECKTKYHNALKELGND